MCECAYTKVNKFVSMKFRQVWFLFGKFLDDLLDATHVSMKGHMRMHSRWKLIEEKLPLNRMNRISE